ncbi:MAG: molybdate ABC transporter substrate-binding protein [Pseudomonadota bacterium]
MRRQPLRPRIRLRESIAGACSLLIAAALGAIPAHAAEITVFAAASLKEALEDVTDRWSHETGHTARLSFAGSATLARQIAFGAPADVFISANAAWMDSLAADDLLAEDTRRDILANSLVLIAPRRQAAGTEAPPMLTRETAVFLFDRLGGQHLAMALVEAVPAGLYGKAALESLGLWQRLAPQVAQTDNVRTALALVARGEAPLGIVYATDAQAEPRVSVLARFRPEDHPPITYPAAALHGADPTATAYLAFLRTMPAREAFARRGFRPLP